jgi:hypothetical protein
MLPFRLQRFLYKMLATLVELRFTSKRSQIAAVASAR